MKQPVAVACLNASGIPDARVFELDLTQQQMDAGEHYALASAQAEGHGYEQPFICYDLTESQALEIAGARMMAARLLITGQLPAAAGYYWLLPAPAPPTSGHTRYTGRSEACVCEKRDGEPFLRFTDGGRQSFVSEGDRLIGPLPFPEL